MINEQAEKDKGIRNIFLGLIYFVIISIAISVVYTLFTKPATALNPEWKTITIGTPALQLETLVALHPMDIALTDDMKAVLKRYDSFVSLDDSGILITVTTAELQPDVYADIESDSGLVNMLQTKFEGTNVKLIAHDLFVDSLSARRLEGVVYIKGVLHLFNKLIIENTSETQAVLVMISTETPGAINIVNRVIESVRIPKP